MLLRAQPGQPALPSGTGSEGRAPVVSTALPFEPQFTEATVAYRGMLETLLLSSNPEIAKAAQRLVEANRTPTRPSGANVMLAYRQLYLKVWRFGNSIEQEQMLIADWYRRGLGRLSPREKSRFLRWLIWTAGVVGVEQEFDASYQAIGHHRLDRERMLDWLGLAAVIAAGVVLVLRVRAML